MKNEELIYFPLSIIMFLKSIVSALMYIVSALKSIVTALKSIVRGADVGSWGRECDTLTPIYAILTRAGESNG